MECVSESAGLGSPTIKGQKVGMTEELGQLVAGTGYDTLTPLVIERAECAILEQVSDPVLLLQSLS